MRARESEKSGFAEVVVLVEGWVRRASGDTAEVYSFSLKERAIDAVLLSQLHSEFYCFLFFSVHNNGSLPDG